MVQPLVVLEFRGEFNYPALLMLLFCTILRRNYPARLNGQGLKSQGLFVFFFFLCPRCLSLSLSLVPLTLLHPSYILPRGITISISPRFYRFSRARCP